MEVFDDFLDQNMLGECFKHFKDYPWKVSKHQGFWVKQLSESHFFQHTFLTKIQDFCFPKTKIIFRNCFAIGQSFGSSDDNFTTSCSTLICFHLGPLHLDDEIDKGYLGATEMNISSDKYITSYVYTPNRCIIIPRYTRFRETSPGRVYSFLKAVIFFEVQEI